MIGVGRESDSHEEIVVYRALYDSAEFGHNALWTRPLANFVETVEQDGKQVPRFLLIEEVSE